MFVPTSKLCMVLPFFNFDPPARHDTVHLVYGPLADVGRRSDSSSLVFGTVVQIA